MHSLPPPWLSACLLLVSLTALLASTQVRAQSSIQQVPAHPPSQTTQPKPEKAARIPVRQVGQEHVTPVVHPSGPAHPIKPPEGRQPHLPLPPPLPELNANPSATPSPTVPAPPKPTKPGEEEKPAGTGLPLPRFAALRSDDVNLRAGPGTRYPIEWVYKRRDLPMEIEREFEVWRLVKDPDGIRGWVHQATLTGRRTFLVQGTDATLRTEPRDDATPVAILKVGVIGRIRSCDAGSDWCRVQVGDYRGFLKRPQFWGALPDEVIVP